MLYAEMKKLADAGELALAIDKNPNVADDLIEECERLRKERDYWRTAFDDADEHARCTGWVDCMHDSIIEPAREKLKEERKK